MAKQAVVTANVKLQFMGNDQDKYVGKIVSSVFIIFII